MDSDEKRLILMIDDNENDFILINDMIEEAAPGEYSLLWAPSFNRGREMAASSYYALIFLDYRLGDGDGLKFLKEANAQNLKTPVILLTGGGNDGVGVEAIRRGASDYLVKGEVTPALLERTIRHAIERQKILAELKASEEKFRAVFEDSGIGMAITDIDGLISDTNSCFQEMFGKSGESLRGRPLTSLVYPDDECLAACLARLRDGNGTCASVESMYIAHGGKTLWGKTLFSSIPDENGNPRNVIAMISDVTKAKLDEERIADMARFPEQNPFPVIRIAAHGVISYANNASALVLAAWSASIGKKVPPGVMDTCVSSMRSKLMDDIEVDCGGRIFSLVFSPVPEMGYVNVYGREITDWKAAERKLQLAATVYENVVEGIMVTDAEGVILSVNPAFTAITGFAAAEAVGKKPSILKSGHHDADFYREMWKEIMRDRRWKGEILNRRKNGEIYPQGTSITGVAGSQGMISQYVCVFQDITEIKAHQDEIKYHAYHDHLTGLPNRILFDDRLRHAMARAMRDNKKAAVMYIDLDGFKQINDTHGHNVGDLILRGVAVRLASTLREEDTISRLGGDEFVVLLEHTGHKRGVKYVAGKILSAVKEPFSLNGVEISVGASIGIVMFPCETQDYESLIKMADTAMYSAKQEGKNRFMFYSGFSKK